MDAWPFRTNVLHQIKQFNWTHCDETTRNESYSSIKFHFKRNMLYHWVEECNFTCGLDTAPHCTMLNYAKGWPLSSTEYHTFLTSCIACILHYQSLDKMVPIHYLCAMVIKLQNAVLWLCIEQSTGWEWAETSSVHAYSIHGAKPLSSSITHALRSHSHCIVICSLTQKLYICGASWEHGECQMDDYLLKTHLLGKADDEDILFISAI